MNIIRTHWLVQFGTQLNRITRNSNRHELLKCFEAPALTSIMTAPCQWSTYQIRRLSHGIISLPWLESCKPWLRLKIHHFVNWMHWARWYRWWQMMADENRKLQSLWRSNALWAPRVPHVFTTFFRMPYVLLLWYRSTSKRVIDRPGRKHRSLTVLLPLSFPAAMDVVSPFQIPAEHLKDVVKNYDDIKTVGAFLDKQNHKYVRVGWLENSQTAALPLTRELTLHRYCQPHSCLLSCSGLCTACN